MEQELTKEPDDSGNKWLKSLPNQLTIFRIATVPVLLLLYPLQIKSLNYFLAFLFAIASITDWLDGVIARRYDSVTKLGKILDPVADKVLVCAGFVLLATQYRWLSGVFGLLLCREFIVNGIRLIAAQQNLDIPVSWMGKWKTMILDVAIVCLMVREDLFELPFNRVGHGALWIGTFFSLYSGFKYVKTFWKESGI